MEIRVGGRGIYFRRKSLFFFVNQIALQHCYCFFLHFKYYFNDRLRKCLLKKTVYCYKTKCNKFSFFLETDRLSLSFR